MSEELTHERLKELLHYDPETGGFFWRVSRPNARVGDLAGSIFGTGYWYVTVDGKKYRSSRLAYFYMLGEWPVEEIDHCDCDSLNDSWANLRPATSKENKFNRKARYDSETGYKGVQKRGQRFRAYVTIDKVFYDLGTYGTFEEACEVRKNAASEIHGEFARHD